MPFNTALSGLNAASQDLRVIGHNVANASTTGFKQSRAEFVDVFATSPLGATSTAIGSGVRIAAVSQQFSQGNVEFTNNNLDLAITGQGFFRLDDRGAIVYSRAGAFGVDREGFIVNALNQNLTGYLADASGTVTGALGNLQLDTSDIAPNATTLVEFGLNLDATSPIPTSAPFDPANALSYNNATSVTIFDSLGSPHLLTQYYVKNADNDWQVHTYIDGTAASAPAGDNITFNPDGTILTPAPAQVALPAFVPTGGALPLNVSMDYSLTTQYGADFSVNALTQDGFTTGRLSGIDFSDTGVLTARYTNGQFRVLGQVAMTNFSNPQGLRQLGDTSWAESYESGAALVGTPGTASLGLIQSGALEGSNVDLTAQLVKMITAQRNFQANAEVITTADTVTQTIINIR